jgi:tripartite-type tricarboxylate transporter receptor subunit TctC
MKHLARLALVLGIAPTPSVTHAQDAWPSRSITFIVPYAAGGYTDLVGRMAARYVESALGKIVIVDNRAGAGGIVGTQAVANAAPDGYTFCVCSVGAVSIAPFAQKAPGAGPGTDRHHQLDPAGGHRQQEPAVEDDD